MTEKIINTAIGTGNVTPAGKRIVLDMANDIGFLEPSANPLVVLSKKANTSPCSSYKYEWIDNTTDVRWLEVGTAATAAATAIVLAAGSGKFVSVNDLIKVAASGEVMRVTAIAGDTLTVARDVGTAIGSAPAIAAKASLLVIGNSSMQGSGAPAENIAGTLAFENYTQIFKTPFSITNTLDATTLYGMQEMARLRKQAGIQHAKSLEYALLFGQKSIDTSGAQPITTTEGIVSSILKNGNTTAVKKAEMSEAKVMLFCEEIFQYGGSSRTCLCSPDFLSWFSQAANTKLQLIQSDMDKTYGLNVTRYATPHGMLDLVLHPLLRTGYSGTLVALAMEDIHYKPLKGRDTKLMTNIQDNDEDGERDQYITEAGIMLRMPKKHGIFTITA